MSSTINIQSVKNQLDTYTEISKNSDHLFNANILNIACNILFPQFATVSQTIKTFYESQSLASTWNASSAQITALFGARCIIDWFGKDYPILKAFSLRMQASTTCILAHKAFQEIKEQSSAQNKLSKSNPIYMYLKHGINVLSSLLETQALGAGFLSYLQTSAKISTFIKGTDSLKESYASFADAKNLTPADKQAYYDKVDGLTQEVKKYTPDSDWVFRGPTVALQNMAQNLKDACSGSLTSHWNGQELRDLHELNPPFVQSLKEACALH